MSDLRDWMAKKAKPATDAKAAAMYVVELFGVIRYLPYLSIRNKYIACLVHIQELV